MERLLCNIGVDCWESSVLTLSVVAGTARICKVQLDQNLFRSLLKVANVLTHHEMWTWPRHTASLAEAAHGRRQTLPTILCYGNAKCNDA